MLDNLFFLLWFLLPAGIANMVPVFAAKLPVLRDWNYPLDGFATLHGKRLLGDHKTIRGLFVGIIAGMAISWLQFAVLKAWPQVGVNFPADYLSADPILLGFLLGFGALAGDAVKSLLKRAKNIPSGKTWVPFDQIDYVLGALIATHFLVPLSVIECLVLIILGLAGHMLVVYVGYLLKLRDQAI